MISPWGNCTRWPSQSPSSSCLRWHHCAQEDHLHSAQFFLPKVTSKTVPTLVWLTTDDSLPESMERWSLPFSTPLSSRQSTLWCSMLWKFLKHLSTSALPHCRQIVVFALLARLPVHPPNTRCTIPVTKWQPKNCLTADPCLCVFTTGWQQTQKWK